MKKSTLKERFSVKVKFHESEIEVVVEDTQHNEFRNFLIPISGAEIDSTPRAGSYVLDPTTDEPGENSTGEKVEKDVKEAILNDK